MWSASIHKQLRNGSVRCIGSVRNSSSRPELNSLLPKKRTFNRILFDNNSQISYNKMIPVLEAIYKNLDTPDAIVLPKYVKSTDLMVFKTVLATIRKTTNAINSHLVALENELTEQAAELGDNDAIAILAFENIEKYLNKTDSSITKEDFTYANELVKKLTDMKHPLVFKLAGDMAFRKGYYEQAEKYWLEFVELESNTVQAAQVYSNLGIYYFSYKSPKPDLTMAKYYFEKSIKFGELDEFIIKSHYYLGQFYSTTSPLTARYHWVISASKGLKESFSSLGFLEMNVFQDYYKSIEWFKLGVEASNDLTCMIGQFDCYLRLNDFKSSYEILTKLKTIEEKVRKVMKSKVEMPEDMKRSMMVNDGLLKVFFESRQRDIASLAGKIA